MKSIKISLTFNILIVILVTLGTIFMFTGFKFMPSNDLLVATNLSVFKFYTVDSNVLLGIMSLIMTIYEIKYINKKIDKIPEFVYLIKLIGTAGIALTFLVTLIFLTPQYGFYSMYNNTNLLFHLIVPLLSFISYIFFEKHNNKYKYAFLGIIPMFLYSIYYISTILIHLNDGGLTYKYDFYGFLQGKIENIFISIPLIYLVGYLLSVVIILGNKKLAK